MNAPLIPAFLPVALTFGVTLALRLSRIAALQSGAGRLGDRPRTSNNVAARFKFFAAGMTVFLLMWATFTARVLLA